MGLLPEDKKAVYKHTFDTKELFKYKEVTLNQLQIEKRHEFAYIELEIKHEPLADIGKIVYCICEDKSNQTLLTSYDRWRPSSSDRPRTFLNLRYHILYCWIAICNSEPIL